jgi:hypothetical protein
VCNINEDYTFAEFRCVASSPSGYFCGATMDPSSDANIDINTGTVAGSGGRQVRRVIGGHLWCRH